MGAKDRRSTRKVTPCLPESECHGLGTQRHLAHGLAATDFADRRRVSVRVFRDRAQTSRNHDMQIVVGLSLLVELRPAWNFDPPRARLDVPDGLAVSDSQKVEEGALQSGPAQAFDRRFVAQAAAASCRGISGGHLRFRARRGVDL